MIDDFDIRLKKAKTMIKTAYITNYILIVTSIALIIFYYFDYARGASLPYNTGFTLGISLIFLIIFIVLTGFLTILKSRIASIIFLVLIIPSTVPVLLSLSSATMITIPIIALVIQISFIYIYITGIRGTFLYHRLILELSAEDDYQPIICPDCNEANSAYDLKCIYCNSKLRKNLV